MTMFHRFAQQRRLTGVIFLGTAAVAIAAAVLIWFMGLGPFVGVPVVVTVALIVTAVIEFIGARKWEKEGRDGQFE